MRFVQPKSVEQQAKGVLFRSRERLPHQRTEPVSALRAVLYEYGRHCHVDRAGFLIGMSAGKLNR